MKSSLSLVMHAEAPLSSINACESELNVPMDAIRSFAQVVVIPVRVALRMGLLVAPVAVSKVAESRWSVLASHLHVADTFQ